jgi:hypothetical protein
MAMLCPQCDMPMSKDEALTGVCPVCAAPLPGQVPPVAEEPAPPPPPRPSRRPLWILCGAVAVCLLLAVIFLPNWSGDTEEDEKPTTPTVAERGKEKVDAHPTPPDNEPKKIPPESRPQPAEPKKVEEPKPPMENPVQPKPEPVVLKGQRIRTVPFLENDAIRIDGDLSDWKGIEPFLLAPIERGKPTNKVVATPKTQKAYVAYCPRGILVAVDVIDTSGKLENKPRPPRGDWAFWDNDAVEVFIDTLNTRAHDRGEESAHQFIALPFGTSKDQGVGGYESRIFMKGKKQQWNIVSLSSSGNNAMLRAGKKTPTGWTLEMLIPTAVLRQAELKPGTVLGFELQIDTGTNIFYYWACDNPLVKVSMHPDFWGEITLGAPAIRGR